MNYQIIAVDFDGTLCFSRWPELGEPNKPLIEYLKSWRNQGNKLILWTCRSGDVLDKAISWCQNVLAPYCFQQVVVRSQGLSLAHSS